MVYPKDTLPNMPGIMAQPNPDPTMIIGSTGLKHHSGFIDEEFLHRLRGRNAIRIYREMIDNSPVIAAAFNVIKMMIRQVEWRVEPADESDEAKIEAEDTEGAFEDMSHTFEDWMAEVLSMLWAGYAPFEIIYKLRKGPSDDPTINSKFNDGKFGWRRIEIRAQDTVDRWVFDHEGGLLGLIQMNVYQTGLENRGPVFIPIEKMLLFRTETFKGNPEGRSLIRPAVIPYWYVKRIQEVESIGVERNLAGMPIMEVPHEILLQDASPEDKATRAFLERFITQVRMDERWGGLIPSSKGADGSCSGFEFKLMQATGRKLIDTDIIIKRHRAEMLMLFLTQFLIMGTDKVGSFSLSSNMTDLFGTALGTIMDSISAVINRFLIPRRQRLNNRPEDLDPILVHGDLEGPNLDEVGKYIQSLAAAGMVSPTRPLERKLLEIGNLPQPPDEDDGLPAPLSETDIDDVARHSLSTDQLQAILDVNAALKRREMDKPAAILTLAAALGVEEEKAAKFIREEVDPMPALPPAPPPGQPRRDTDIDDTPQPEPKPKPAAPPPEKPEGPGKQEL